MSDNDSENDSNESEITLDDLSEEQKDVLLGNPEVRKMLEYEETSIPQVSSMLKNLTGMGSDEAEARESFLNGDSDSPETTYEILIQGISDREGRITRSTVHKVLTGFTREFESVQKWRSEDGGVANR